jgi:immune inhibitor A
MRTSTKALIALVPLVSMMTAVNTSVSSAAETTQDAQYPLPNHPGGDTDDLSNPLADAQREARATALEAQLQGKIPADRTVAEVAKGQFVELAREDEDLIFTVLGEFSDTPFPNPLFAGGLPGPQHNEIPEPDRSVDNSSMWVPDFSQAHYEELLFSTDPEANSMTTYYEEQSSGRYTVDGDITDWGQVPFDTAFYGRDYCGSIVCPTTWYFVQDTAAAWYQSQIDAGMTADQIDDYLSKFDVWDRYDHDGDGDFDEADGYIDHFQAVHAGPGQEAGGGEFGADAIWSHRWYVQLTGIGAGGPELDNGTTVPFGGTQIGGSKYWIGDYTVEPEDGGVGVFVHEFAHDLDLPDLYDTSGNTGGAENSTGFWTLMSSGSNTGDGVNTIGNDPTHMGAWEKFQLGWLNYEVGFAGERSSHKLGPASTNTKQAQALIVVLPDKDVTAEIGTPFEGEHFFYSGSGDDLDHTMVKEFDLPAGASLEAQADYDIELDWDYAYLIASGDGGATWANVATNLSTNDNPNGGNFGTGITGASGGWTTLTADLSAYTGPTLIGFRYFTDGAVANPGFSVDAIDITGQPLEGAESLDGWELDGFSQTTGTESLSYFNAYIAAFRNYRGYDANLDTGPYNFGFLDDPALGNYVERFPYQDGMLVSYWDTSETDNSVGAHPGSGLILPVDAHPEPLIRADGGVWRNRVQSYDSTFSKDATEEVTLHWFSGASTFPSLPGEPVFDDTNSYWSAAPPTGSVITPVTGTSISSKSVSARGNFMQVQVRPS